MSCHVGCFDHVAIMINRYITRYNGRNNLSKVFDETCFNEVGIGRNGTSSRSFFHEMVQ